jgi:DNA-binding beta-propeller fold protein YncE
MREVWVTTPKDRTVTILDASKPAALKAKTTIKIDGAPEGYAVDDEHGLFFTNLEDKGGTLAIDVKTHKVKATWNAGCNADKGQFTIVATGETSDGARNAVADGRGDVYVPDTKAARLLIFGVIPR